MSTFQQPCPSCASNLELPVEALGKMAKCPACQTQFVANGPPEEHPENSSHSSSVAPSVSADDADASMENPYAQALGGRPVSTNPYSPPTDTHVVSHGPFQIREVAFDEVWGPAWEITKARFGVTLGAIIIMMAISIAFSFVSQIMVGIAAAINEDLAGIGMFAMMPFSFLLNAYTTVGLAGAAIAIARNQESPLSKLFAPMPGVLRYMGILAIFGMVAAVVVGVFVALGLLIGQANGDLAVIGGVVAVLILVVAGLALGFFIWPLAYLCAENRTSMRESVVTCIEITKRNFVTILLMLVVSAGLTLLGFVMCYVGIFATMPLVTMLIAVAYLQMTGQPISVPQRFVATPPQT